MEVARLGERDYIRYFGSDSPLEVYLAYWKFDGGWESLWSYVLEKAAVGLGMPRATPEERAAEDAAIGDVADQLRRDAASEAVMSAKYNAGVEYGPNNGATVVYDEILDGYCLKEANGCERWHWSEKIVDMQEIARELVSLWWEYEG